MSDTAEQEKIKLAEEFVRSALKHLQNETSEEVIKAVARKVAKSLPPYIKRKGK